MYNKYFVNVLMSIGFKYFIDYSLLYGLLNHKSEI